MSTIDLVAAFSIGITSARSGDWKRGVAANVAARLAADGVPGVAVVDADPSGRDVGARLGRASRGRIEWPDLFVVPAPAALTVAEARARVAVAVHDHNVVVVDLPRGAGAPGPALDCGLVDDLDRLVVMTDLSTDALRATARWAELVAVARRRGHIGRRVEIVAAICGERFAVDDLAERAVERVAATVGLPVVASVPQWWGRTPPNHGFGPTLGFAMLDEALRDVSGYGANRSHAVSASGQSRAAIHGAVASVK